MSGEAYARSKVRQSDYSQDEVLSDGKAGEKRLTDGWVKVYHVHRRARVTKGKQTLVADIILMLITVWDTAIVAPPFRNNGKDKVRKMEYMSVSDFIKSRTGLFWSMQRRQHSAQSHDTQLSLS
jgi:hypothetical protein